MHTTTCIIETPKGTTGKINFDPETGTYQLSKILSAGLAFPFDFGYIPGTLAADGDPLDVLVVSETPGFVGANMECRIVGAIKARQKEHSGEEERNDRLIAIPTFSLLYKHIKDADDLPKEVVSAYEQFFINYNYQSGKEFKPLEWVNAKGAWKLVEEACNNAKPEKVVQLFLPLEDRDGKAIAEAAFTAVKHTLAKRYGGVTIYSQAPAEGLWAADKAAPERDRLVIFEVMVPGIDTGFWKPFKAQLEKDFRQEEVLIRHYDIGII